MVFFLQLNYKYNFRNPIYILLDQMTHKSEKKTWVSPFHQFTFSTKSVRYQ